MSKEKAYSIEKLYADCSILDSKLHPVEVQLKISLGFSDWCKFQEQLFSQELMRYLNNVKTQEQDIGPDKQKNLQENTECE